MQQDSTNSTIRQFDVASYIPNPSFFISDFVNHFTGYTDAPKAFGYGLALLALGQCLKDSSVNLTPPWRHNLFLFFVGSSGTTRKTTTVGVTEAMDLPIIPFGTIESTKVFLAKSRKSGILTLDECSGILKMCQRPTYLQGLAEFYNRLYDGTRLEHNTRKYGLIVAVGHYVSVVMSTTQEGFAASVDEEILYNGFVNRFLVLVGEGNPRPRRVLASSVSASLLGLLKGKLDAIKKLKITFEHSDSTALQAHESLRKFEDMDPRLISRVEEHVLQISDIIALDRSITEHNLHGASVTVTVTEADVATATQFVVGATLGLKDLLRVVSMPPGALRELYQIIHRLHKNQVKKFTKSQVLKSTNKYRARDIGDALYTAVEARYLKVKRLKRKGEQYTILEDPLENDNRTVESSNLSNTTKPVQRSRTLTPQTCPYADECGYRGVFLWTDLFDQHMEEYHGMQRVAATVSY